MIAPTIGWASAAASGPAHDTEGGPSMQTERTPLTPEQISLVVDTLQAEVEQAARSLESAYEYAKTIEYSTDLHAPGGHWYYVGEAAGNVAENLGGRSSEINPELALRHIQALRDLVALATSRDGPLEAP